MTKRKAEVRLRRRPEYLAENVACSHPSPFTGTDPFSRKAFNIVQRSLCVPALLLIAALVFLHCGHVRADVASQKAEELYHQAMTAYDRGDYEKAISQLGSVIEMTPSNSVPYVSRAKARMQAGHLTQALHDCEQALAINPNHIDAYRTKGHVLCKLGRYRRAIEACTDAIRMDPSNSYTYLVRGNASAELREFDEAISDYSAAIRLNPEYSEAYHNLANLQFLQRQYSEALDNLNRAIELRPRAAESFALRGKVYEAQGEYNSAISDYTTALLSRPDLLAIYSKRGYCFAKTGNTKAAIRDYSKAIDSLPNAPSEFFQTRGSLYSLLKQYDKAIADMDEAVQRGPSRAEPYSYRGYIKSLSGDYADGLDDCRKAVEIDGKCAVALNNYAWLLAVSPSSELRDGELAVKLAQTACELSNWDDPHFLGTLAAAYAEVGQFEDAVKWQKKSIQLGLDTGDATEATKRLELYENDKPFHEGDEVLK